VPSIKVLVVDDFEPFRRLLYSTLEKRAGFQVIDQASDGLEAVQKAEELQPDLILLDIGLPKLNGIEAAKRIRKVAPHSIILFLSQESSSDMVRETLRLGAMGYVHKSRTQSDLLPALEAVLAGKRFVSSDLVGWESTEGTAARVPHRHEILLCSDEAVLLEGFTRFISAALRFGNSAIVIATKSHLDFLCQALKAEGLDVDGGIQKGTYISLDCADMPSRFMENGWPELTRCFETAFKATETEHRRVALCGECAGGLWAECKTDAAIHLEQLCDDLAKKHDVDILCAYPLSGVSGNQDENAFKNICAEHSAVHSR
jgi:DNA-binding NarL/FixJ family response regulator